MIFKFLEMSENRMVPLNRILEERYNEFLNQLKFILFTVDSMIFPTN